MAESIIPAEVPRRIYVTVDTTRLTSSESIRVWQCGKVVQVVFWGTLASFTGVEENVVTGLPMAIDSMTANIAGGGTGSNVSYGNAYIRGGQTTLQINVTTANIPFYGTLTYMTY